MSESNGAYDPGEGTSKHPLDVDNSPPPAFGPAILGLLPVGTKLPAKPPSTQPVQVLNARGMPARIRKKNRLFFDDDIINDKLPSTRATPKKGAAAAAGKDGGSATKTPQQKPGSAKRRVASKSKSTPRGTQAVKREVKVDPDEQLTPKTTENRTAHDRQVSQLVGKRLRNLLKLPKAHRMVGYEYFYSTIDKALLLDSGFWQQVKSKFPHLYSREMTRAELNKVRSAIGKPRRLSAAFLQESRAELRRQRMKVRLLQMGLPCDRSFAENLPDVIPGILPIGTKVSAKIRGKQDGLFTGTIESMDTSNFSYRINFERFSLGSHSVPDFEVGTNDTVPMLQVNKLTTDLRYKLRGAAFYTRKVDDPKRSAGHKGDPLLGSHSSIKTEGVSQSGVVFPRDNIGGFPVDLLELIVRTKKTLNAKQMKLLRLQNMNAEAEIFKSYNDPFPDEFQRRYALLLIALEKLNGDLQRQTRLLQERSMSLTKDENLSCMLAPTFMREQCRQKAEETYSRNNNNVIRKEPIAKLIKDLTTVLHITANLGSGALPKSSARCDTVRVLRGFMEEVKTRIDPDNLAAFHRNVEQHINKIVAGYQATVTVSEKDVKRIKDDPAVAPEQSPR